jgi:hypothetical protein
MFAGRNFKNLTHSNMRTITTRLGLLFCLAVFATSCSSVFQGRHFSHLNYVKPQNPPQSASIGSATENKEEIQSLNQKETPLDLSADAGEPVPELKETLPGGLPHVSPDRALKEVLDFYPVQPLKKLHFLIPHKQESVDLKSRQLFGDLDRDLRMALYFGILGILVLILAAIPDIGFIFGIIGAILLLIALVYLIKYIVENG